MDIIEKFKKQHLILKILEIAFIILFIYEIMTLHTLRVSLWIVGIIILIECFKGLFKKEE